MLTAFSNWLVQTPLWAIGLVMFGGMIGASLIGWALRRRHNHARGIAGESEDGEQGMMVPAIMGLMALLVAFTFSLAVDRFDARRGNVLLEANAIGTTYLRAQLLEQPHRARMSKLLADYTDTRISLATTPPSPAQRPLLATSDRLIADLWTETVAAFPSMRPYPSSSAFLETMNELIDMDAVRKAGRQAQVPSEVFLVLFLYQFITAGVIGYVVTGNASRKTALVLFLLLGIFMVLILDINRPTTGGITESQEPMLQLQAFIKAQPPESFDRFNLPSQAPSPGR
ncbi:hypothetical protein [Sphingomonas sp. LaA6.9]|uniref:bestrophin-like domain n=1 Tax=Sphingomonas sp. LaA6.9 TaxID=2919914 RepID=UPI001F4FAD33|nr:hypothetical protein [Sphingomonas sp. LaA6.9]MCJ8156642.1 hypothetical protein [Sphingomonas sp. LaA6.9]